MSDERVDENDRLQEILERTMPAESRETIERDVLASPAMRRELERLRRLDALLAEAVPEPWPAVRTERVVAALDVAPRRSRLPARLIQGALTAVAAAAALLLWGAPLLDLLPAIPADLGAAAGRMLDAMAAEVAAPEDVSSIVAVMVAAGLLVAALATGAVAARIVREEVSRG